MVKFFLLKRNTIGSQKHVTVSVTRSNVAVFTETPVSYTHLDVYKRQQQIMALCHALEDRGLFFTFLWCPGPVSYTHLDVYKRQPLYCIHVI